MVGPISRAIQSQTKLTGGGSIKPPKPPKESMSELDMWKDIRIQCKVQYSCANIVQWKPPATKLQGGVYTPTYFVRHDIIRFEESF